MKRRLLSSLKNWINEDRSDFIRTLLLSEGFGFCLFLSLVWGYRLDRHGSVAGWLIQSILLSLLLGSTLSDMLMCTWALRRGREARTADRAPAVSTKVWFISAAIILAAWIPVWVAYYPAVFAYDAETQLGQHISRMYSTHHPLLHTLIMGRCMDLMWNAGGINAGMALYAVLQMIFMAGVLGWTVAEAHRVGTPRWLTCIYGVFCALFPVHPILAVSTTKDVVFSGLVPVFVLLLRRSLCGDASPDGRGDRGLLIRICITAGFMVLFRNNALYALVLTMIVLAAGRKVTADLKKRLVLTILAGCAAGCLINAGLKIGLHADSGSPREALSIPIQQMARVYVRHGDELPAELASDLGIMLNGSRDEITARYNEHLADPVKKEMFMKDPAGFMRTWILTGVRFPGEYLDAWLYTTEGAWYMGDTSIDRIYGEGRETGFGYLSTDTRSMPEGFEVTSPHYLPGLHDMIESIVSDNAFERIPLVRFLFSPAVYVWILAAYAYVSRVRRDSVTVTALVYPLAVYLTILMGPAVLVRYMYPFMLLVIVPMMPGISPGMKRE